MCAILSFTDVTAVRMHTLHKATQTWYEMQDLHVWTTETMPQVSVENEIVSE